MTINLAKTIFAQIPLLFLLGEHFSAPDRMRLLRPLGGGAGGVMIHSDFPVVLEHLTKGCLVVVDGVGRPAGAVVELLEAIPRQGLCLGVLLFADAGVAAEDLDRFLDAGADDFLFPHETDRLERHLGLLHKRVQERIKRQEINQRFHHAQRLEVLGTLAGSVAHDFNNILTTIGGMARLVRDDHEENAALCSDLDEIIGASDRATALTGQLLAFSRKQILQPSAIRLEELVDNLLPLLRRLIGEDIDLCVDLQDTPLVLADPNHVEQIIINLAVNARDAMPQGGTLTIGTTTVETVRSDARSTTPGPYGVIEVRDTGCGIAEELREKIFDPFFTTKENGSGTGLGLSTVKGIVHQWSGMIEVESRPGHGALFRVYLPSTERTTPAPNETDEEPIGDGSETILLVEDDPSVLSLLERTLDNFGYRVLAARNGMEALELAELHSMTFDLLVSDVNLPKMNGRVLGERLREKRPDLKVLYICGYTDDVLLRQGLIVGNMRLINKPFSPRRLVREVRRSLDAG
ncbi:MAG: response regulator [Sumerlaeia bacterium]